MIGISLAFPLCSSSIMLDTSASSHSSKNIDDSHDLDMYDSNCALAEESRARRLTCWEIFQQYTGNIRHHDQSCDRAIHWTSVACVSTRSGLFRGMGSLSA